MNIVPGKQPGREETSLAWDSGNTSTGPDVAALHPGDVGKVVHLSASSLSNEVVGLIVSKLFAVLEGCDCVRNPVLHVFRHELRAEKSLTFW